MQQFYKRYQQGYYQEVYNELLDMKENIHNSSVYEDAQLVMREIMRRVRSNIELIVSRLNTLGYQFRKGTIWETASYEERVQLEKEYPIFQLPTSETLKHIIALEQLTGSLPMSLRCFFEKIGCVNFTGLFSSNERSYGPTLDPLCIQSVEIALQMVTSLKRSKLGDLWEEEPLLILAGDKFHKYGYSGSGPYQMKLPCSAFDALFLDEPHETTLVNYLRICMKWGGFPGLEQDNRLPPEQFVYLTEGLLPF